MKRRTSPPAFKMYLSKFNKGPKMKGVFFQHPPTLPAA